MRAITIAATALFLAGAGITSAPLTAAALQRTKVAATTQIAAASAAHRKAHHHTNATYVGGQIACTPLGCGRVPRNCHPTTAYYWDGTPTGYDAVVCP